MKKFLKKLFRLEPSNEGLKYTSVEDLLPKMLPLQKEDLAGAIFFGNETDVPKTPVIGEPVASIIEATKDLDRWVVVIDDNDYLLMDTKVQKSFRMSYGWNHLNYHWLSRDEAGALSAAFVALIHTKDQLVIEKERQLLVNIYCVQENW